MKKKIGLCLAFKGTNYGMHLQSYATQYVVDRLGYETEIIDYHSGINKGVRLSIGALYVAIQKVSSKFFKLLRKEEPLDELHQENIIERRAASDTFRKKRLHNIVKVEGIAELKHKSHEYAAVLVGSDQIWLPDVAFSNFYTLRFAAPGVKRISYATSLGVSEYPKYAKRAAADYWRQINCLSVREEQGKEIIQSIVDVPVEVVVDPTYLLTKEEWEELIPHEKVINNSYVLCYFLGDDDVIKRYAKAFARQKKLRLVSILSNECCSDDTKYADEVIIGKSPEEFVNLIRNADYVLTDSFHGLAFSIINEKQFLVFYRKRMDVKESRNSRIDNIVRAWKIEDRLIQKPDTLQIPATEIDYKCVTAKVSEIRYHSFMFLKNALKV